MNTYQILLDFRTDNIMIPHAVEKVLGYPDSIEIMYREKPAALLIMNRSSVSESCSTSSPDFRRIAEKAWVFVQSMKHSFMEMAGHSISEFDPGGLYIIDGEEVIFEGQVKDNGTLVPVEKSIGFAFYLDSAVRFDDEEENR